MGKVQKQAIQKQNTAVRYKQMKKCSFTNFRERQIKMRYFSIGKDFIYFSFNILSCFGECIC